MVGMSRRERLHEEMREEIKQIARCQMAAEGNEALSLRAIARQMAMTAPALYRYFANREDLITALILDAFNGLSDAMEAANASQCAQRGPNAYGARLLAVMHAYRDWALAHPTDFALIYGTPIPGYQAPAQTTAAASARGIAVVITILTEALTAGVLTVPPELQHVPPTVAAKIATWLEQRTYPSVVQTFYIGVIGWTRCHGLIMLELFHHTTPVVGDTDALYRAEITTFLTRLGLPP